MYTPPFGLNLFVATSITKLPIMRVTRGVLPFIWISLISLILITYFPQISLWLPRLIYGNW
jgi:C4-dicarboxylate transporter DctM subunit